MNFSDVLNGLKAESGSRYQRAGWNGKGMWITLSPGGVIDEDEFWAPANKVFAQDSGGTAEVRPYITMKAADDTIVPWVASQTDLLADDWEMVGQVGAAT